MVVPESTETDRYGAIGSTVPVSIVLPGTFQLRNKICFPYLHELDIFPKWRISPDEAESQRKILQIFINIKRFTFLH